LNKTNNFITGAGIVERTKQQTRISADFSMYGRKQKLAYFKLIQNQVNGGKTKGQFHFVNTRRKKYD
jgi:hypothetical protein